MPSAGGRPDRAGAGPAARGGPSPRRPRRRRCAGTGRRGRRSRRRSGRGRSRDPGGWSRGWRHRRRGSVWACARSARPSAGRRRPRRPSDRATSGATARRRRPTHRRGHPPRIPGERAAERHVEVRGDLVGSVRLPADDEDDHRGPRHRRASAPAPAGSPRCRRPSAGTRSPPGRRRRCVSPCAGSLPNAPRRPPRRRSPTAATPTSGHPAERDDRLGDAARGRGEQHRYARGQLGHVVPHRLGPRLAPQPAGGIDQAPGGGARRQHLDGSTRGIELGQQRAPGGRPRRRPAPAAAVVTPGEPLADTSTIAATGQPPRVTSERDPVVGGSQPTRRRRPERGTTTDTSIRAVSSLRSPTSSNHPSTSRGRPRRTRGSGSIADDDRVTRHQAAGRLVQRELHARRSTSPATDDVGTLLEHVVGGEHRALGNGRRHHPADEVVEVVPSTVTATSGSAATRSIRRSSRSMRSYGPEVVGRDQHLDARARRHVQGSEEQPAEQRQARPGGEPAPAPAGRARHPRTADQRARRDGRRVAAAGPRGRHRRTTRRRRRRGRQRRTSPASVSVGQHAHRSPIPASIDDSLHLVDLTGTGTPCGITSITPSSSGVSDVQMTSQWIARLPGQGCPAVRSS